MESENSTKRKQQLITTKKSRSHVKMVVEKKQREKTEI